MTIQHIETLIVGAGQSGLATAYHLRRAGCQVLVVDEADRIGDNWRRHYDSLTLFTPARYDGLPGLPFPSDDPWHFPGKDEVAAFLELYALTFDLPVRTGTRVHRIGAHPDGGFVVGIGTDQIICDNVVVATGTFGRTPYVPPFAAELAPEIRQLHSSQYHRPAQLTDGPTLVVGASHSGCDIALELAGERPTTLVGRDCGEMPVQWGSPQWRRMIPVAEFAFKHMLTRRTPMGRRLMPKVRQHGGPRLRVHRVDLQRAGVTWIDGRVTGVSAAGRPVVDGERNLDAANVVWCTGYRQVFDWIDLPVVADDGWPVEYRGVVESVPGLYFCGLSFQYSFSSMTLPGVDRDTTYVARRIAARSRPARKDRQPVVS